MPGWFAFAAPYIPEIIRLARPLFTRASPKDEETDITARQIAELQTAASQNAESIKHLATDMQRTLEALQNGTAEMEKKLNRAHTLLIIASTVAALSFCLAVYALARVAQLSAG